MLLFLLACSDPRSGTWSFSTVTFDTDCPDEMVSDSQPEGDQTLSIDPDAVVLKLRP